MTPAAPQTPALWAALWRSSSASSSRCTCAELSGARGGRPSRGARRDPGDKRSHMQFSSITSKMARIIDTTVVHNSFDRRGVCAKREMTIYIEVNILW